MQCHVLCGILCYTVLIAFLLIWFLFSSAACCQVLGHMWLGGPPAGGCSIQQVRRWLNQLPATILAEAVTLLLQHTVLVALPVHPLITATRRRACSWEATRRLRHHVWHTGTCMKRQLPPY